MLYLQIMNTGDEDVFINDNIFLPSHGVANIVLTEIKDIKIRKWE